MPSDGCHMWFEDGVGNEYGLTEDMVYFATLQMGETKVVGLYLCNIDRGASCVILTLIPHPTNQKGTAEDTYGASGISTSDSGPFTNPLIVGCVSPGAKIPIYIEWDVPAGALPGIGQFAIKVEGDLTI